MTNIVKLDPEISNLNELVYLLGVNDKNIKLLGKLLKVNIYSNNEEILIDSEDEEKKLKLKKIFQVIIKLIRNNIVFSERDIIYLFHTVDKIDNNEIISLFLSRKEIIKTYSGKPVFPKTINQKKYLESIENNTLIFGIGPAGTGKTYLAVLSALKKLKNNQIKRIILTRPAVEAGEKLGFLPGDLKEKIDPYLRPLYDAMYEILGVKQSTEFIEKGIIEIAPLAYMRGRTLENAYVILDEAQNTTINQMKLFLTRLGFGSKMIVTGDITQSDLPPQVLSGLVKASYILKNVDDIKILYFDELDVVRHPLVQTIIKRFEDAKN
ncbi:MAG: PhoH family protein [Candidatus Izemoplasmatales bacterium]|nr:PhoH family protein [Candidatus Izemoplasmatales bacterium]